MKLLVYDKPELQEGESRQIINIKSMIFLFMSDYNCAPEAGDDNAVKSTKQYLECVYAAYDENDKLHIFVQYYSYTHDEEDRINRMRKSSYFDGSINSNQLVTTINFFTGKHQPEVTDLRCDPLDDKFEFTSFKETTSGNDDGTETPAFYTIDDKIKLGIEMLHLILANESLPYDGICDANIWMYDEMVPGAQGYKNLYKHESVASFKIKDISKTTRRKKNYYTGAVALEFVTEGEDGSVYSVLMPYSRPEKLRNKSITMDLSLMDTTYEGAYVIGAFAASPIEESDICRLVGYSKSLDRFVIFDFSKDLHDKFIEEINNI